MTRERWLTALIVISLVAGFAIVALGASVSSRVSGVDLAVAEWVASLRVPAMDTLFWLLTVTGNTGVKLALVVFAAAAWLVWGQPRAAVVLLASLGLGHLVVQTVKLTAQRVRPPGAVALIETPESYSFPSGHAFSGLVFFALLGLLIAAITNRRLVADLALAAGLVIGLSVGASRVYLGVHWFSDVFASWMLGLAWLVLTWSLALKGRLEPDPAHPPGMSRGAAIAVSVVLALGAVAAVALGAGFDPLL